MSAVFGESLQAIVARALAEDLGPTGDLTARVSVPSGARGAARIVAREPGVLAGMEVLRETFRQVDAGIRFDPDTLLDGARLEAGTVVATLSGDAAALLAGERTGLNFLQRLCGIATRTRAFVDAVAGLPVRILDTRKTTPTLRPLERAAVRTGGGDNHRFGLFDQVLLKENHFAMAGRPYQEVVRTAVEAAGGVVIAEARTLAEALAAVAGGAGVVLLDNFAPGPGLRSVVTAVRERAASAGADPGAAAVASTAGKGAAVQIEASGGVTLANVRAFAECGVDRISVGSLTHSVPALDLSMLSMNLT